MFGGNVDLAILSGPLALHRARRFWWSGYAIAGVCGAGCARLPSAPVGCFVLASPNYRAARHRGIVHCAIPQAAFADQSAPALFRSPQGLMTGGCSHNPVTVATPAGGLAGTGPVGRYAPACLPLRPWYRTRGFPARFTGACVDLVDKVFLVQAGNAVGCHLVAQRTLPAFLDPPHLRVGTEMHVWIVGRIIGGILFDTVWLPGRGGTLHQCGVDGHRFGP